MLILNEEISLTVLSDIVYHFLAFSRVLEYSIIRDCVPLFCVPPALSRRPRRRVLPGTWAPGTCMSAGLCRRIFSKLFQLFLILPPCGSS